MVSSSIFFSGCLFFTIRDSPHPLACASIAITTAFAFMKSIENMLGKFHDFSLSFSSLLFALLKYLFSPSLCITLCWRSAVLECVDFFSSLCVSSSISVCTVVALVNRFIFFKSHYRNYDQAIVWIDDFDRFFNVFRPARRAFRIRIFFSACLCSLSIFVCINTFSVEISAFHICDRRISRNAHDEKKNRAK